MVEKYDKRERIWVLKTIYIKGNEHLISSDPQFKRFPLTILS